MRLVLATRNDHKVRELGAPAGRRRRSSRCPPGVVLPPEDGDTFAANALGKARAAAAALGRPAIADDSGVEAEALGGAPGILSARFAGPDATDARQPRQAPRRGARRLRPALRVRDGLRRARTATSATFTGTCEGTLAADARGSGGFGYDPAFLPADVADGRTMAELADAEKDAISHRGRAARALLAWLREERERAA